MTLLVGPVLWREATGVLAQLLYETQRGEQVRSGGAESVVHVRTRRVTP